MSEPNQAWVSDLTYIWTDEGGLYLAGIKDLFSGELVGYAMSERMTRTLVMQALFGAVALKRPAQGLVLHSDRDDRLNPPSTARTTIERWQSSSA